MTNCWVNQISVAEHVLALLFSFEKNIHLQYRVLEKESGNDSQEMRFSERLLELLDWELSEKNLQKDHPPWD